MGQKPWGEQKRNVVNEMFLMFGAVCCRKRYSLGQFPGLPALHGTSLGGKGRRIYRPILEPWLKLPGYYLCIYIFMVTTLILVIY